jgi:MFS family permease
MRGTVVLFAALAVIVGYAYSVVLGGVVIKWVLDRFYSGYEQGRTVEKWRAGVVGLVERTLYTTAFLMGIPEFIAVWLALKVAGQWERWKTDWSSEARSKELKAKKDTSRVMYSGYLLGNALSIAFGVTGASMIQQSLSGRWQTAVALGLVLLALASVLYLYIARHTPRSHSEPPKSKAKPQPTRAPRKRGA